MHKGGSGLRLWATALLGAIAVLLLTAVAASAEAPPKHRGAPKISGSSEDGRVVTVSEGRWKSATQPTFSYQWEVCLPKQLSSCSPIPGAESASYRIATSQIADRLRAIVTATTPGGTAVANSHPTKKIKPGSPIAVEAPAIGGSLQEGATLTADPGNWAGTPPMSFHYQWERCAVLSAICEEILGATAATYTLQALDVASKLLVQVTASNAYGTTTASSSETPAVGAILPVNKVLPVIGGLLQDGQLLSATSGLWSGSEPISYAYQWLLCNAKGESCAEIPEAAGSTLSLLSTEIGDTIKVIVTATNGAGSVEATSAVSSVIAGILPKNTALPSISGLLQDGQLLSAATGSWSGSEPISYSYEWLLCNAAGKSCAEIPEAAGSTLSLLSTEIGDTVKVIVTATNGAGSVEATSAVSSVIAGILPKNTVLPSISGLLQDGQLLSAATGSWSGSEPISYAYEWSLCNAAGKSCAEIPEATGSTLSLLSTEIGDTVKVVVTATNAAGSVEATSPASSLIAGILPKNTALPSISGVTTGGELLSASAGSWSGSEPISYSYQWLLCNSAGKSCAEIFEATGSTLTLLVGDIGKTLKVVVTATNAAGSTEATSAASSVIAGILPKNTGLPSISGVTTEGESLTGSTGSWSGSEPITYKYQWLLCNAEGKSCAEISKASGSTLKLLVGDIGDTVKVLVTAKNVAGTTEATSAASGVIAGILPKNTGLPSISGVTTEGESLTGSTGSWSGSEPITYKYQWLLCNAEGKSCAEISEASGSTLKLLVGDIGDTVKVLVTAKNVAGTAEATSAASSVIAGILPKNTGLPSISGVTTEGESLSASTGSWSGSEPISYSYQWSLCNAEGKSCSEISKATGSTLSLLVGDIGDTVKVLVTAKNVAGTAEATSAASSVIAGIIPKNTALPSITGSLLSGQLLMAHPGSWSGSEPISYTYQWQLCSALGKSCGNIGEATGSTFKLTSLDVGLTLDVVTTAKNVAGSSSATSPVTGLIGL